MVKSYQKENLRGYFEASFVTMEGMKKVAKEGMMLVFGEKARDLNIFEQKVYFYMALYIFIYIFIYIYVCV